MSSKLPCKIPQRDQEDISRFGRLGGLGAYFRFIYTPPCARPRAHVMYRNNLPFSPQAPKACKISRLQSINIFPFWELGRIEYRSAFFCFAVGSGECVAHRRPAFRRPALDLLKSLTDRMLLMSSHQMTLDRLRRNPRLRSSKENAFNVQKLTPADRHQAT